VSMMYLPPATCAFGDALRQIERTEISSLIFELNELRYAGNHSIEIGGAAADCTATAWAQFCAYIDLPLDLLSALPSGLAKIVVRHLQKAGRRARGAPEEIRISMNANGVIVGLTPANVECLTNADVVAALQAAWPSGIPSEMISVTELLIEDTHFELSFSTSRLSAEPRPGDIICGGITIRHSQASMMPTAILSYIHRLVCSNGLTQRICLQGGPSRTKRCQRDKGSEPVVEAIGRQFAAGWMQIADRLDGFKSLLDHPFDADMLPESLRRRWSINRRLAAEIAEALTLDELGRTYTEYDLVNALSRVATHSPQLAPRYRRHLSLAAGMFAQRHIHRCPTCGNWSEVRMSEGEGPARTRPRSKSHELVDTGQTATNEDGQYAEVVSAAMGNGGGCAVQ
jgi:hypothetical protein